jgi:hypothetical protein
VKAVQDVSRLSRKGCRGVFEQRFTAVRMARDYVALYQQLIHAGSANPVEADSVVS